MRVQRVSKHITNLSLYLHKILHGLWWQQQLALWYNKNFQRQHKDLCERCKAGNNPEMFCISAFGNMLDFNQITLYSHLETLSLPTRLYPRYAPINELLGCIVLLVFPLYKYTSGPVIYVMPVRAEYQNTFFVSQHYSFHYYKGARLQQGWVLQKLR